MISVIIPIYNSEKYLQRAVDSILNQSFEDWELILIDDGSTDGSCKICDEYSKQDKRIHVFHRKNHGISATREYGLLQSKGEYIQFVDSDDWIEPNMLERMFSEAVKYNSDIVGCNFLSEYREHSEKHYFSYNSKDDFLRSIISNKWGVLWKHLIRRKIITDNNIHFPQEINNGEDYYFIIRCILAAKKVTFVNDFFYHYFRANAASTISTVTENKTIEQIRATELVQTYLKEMGLLKNYTQELDERKFLAKAPLLQKSKWKWILTFPECNYLYKKHPISKRYYPLILVSNLLKNI